MRITVFAAGSRGDIQPCVALSRRLQEAGYRVCLAAPQDFREFVQEHGVRFCPLRGDVQKIMASDTAREFMETAGSNPFKSIHAMRTLIAPVIPGEYDRFDHAVAIDERVLGRAVINLVENALQAMPDGGRLEVGVYALIRIFTLVFADPPYGKGLGEQATSAAIAGGWLAPGAVIVLEEAAKAEIDQEVNRAKEQLRQQVASIAIAGAGKVLEREVNESAHSEILDKLAAEI